MAFLAGNEADQTSTEGIVTENGGLVSQDRIFSCFFHFPWETGCAVSLLITEQSWFIPEPSVLT